MIGAFPPQLSHRPLKSIKKNNIGGIPTKEDKSTEQNKTDEDYS